MRPLLAILVLNACSGASATWTSPPLPDAPEAAKSRTLIQACSDVATTACVDFDNCPSLWHQFPNAPACLSGMRARCVRDGSARGVREAVRRLDRCVNDLLNLSCPTRVAALLTCLASPGAEAGGLALGASCWTHSQCASGSCGGNDLPLERRCGTCRPTPRPGDACKNYGECMVMTFREPDTNLRCDERTLTCVAGDPEGTPCSADAMRCAPTLACVDGRCTPPDIPVVFAELGEPCHRRNGVEPNDARPLCRGGSWCNLSNVCVPMLQEGAPCTSESYACGWDAVCTWKDGETRCVRIEELCR